MAAPIRFINDLKRFSQQDENIKKNDIDLGTLSAQKYYKNKTFKGKLAKTNPEVSKDSFYDSADTFTFPDENGFTEADVARDRLAKLSYEVFPNPKNDFFLERPESDYFKADSWMMKYRESIDIGFLGEDFVGPDQLNMFEPQALAKQTALTGTAEESPDVKGEFPSQGVTV